MDLRKLAREFEKALMKKVGPSGYDTDATVKRIEDGKAWVSIPGGVPETPIDIGVDAQVGDTVHVRISGGRAWLLGNASHPPTDDRTAKEAQHLAMSSSRRVARIEEEIANGDIGAGTVIWTTTSDPVAPNYTFTITDLQGGSFPHVGDIIFAGAYRYVIMSIGSTTVLAGDRESIKGADGASITGVTEMYALSATLTAPADADFSSNVQTPTELLPYLWNMEVVAYSSGASIPQAKHILLTYTAGVEGRGISSVTEYYCRTTNTTTPADNDFGTTVPTLTETYKYLWNYELITYTDGTSPTKTDKRIIGVYGDRGYGITQIKTHIREQSLATIMSWVGLTNDTWGGVTSFDGKVGDTVLIACKVTDHDNIIGYMRCVVKGYNSGTQVLTTDNLDFMMGEQGEQGEQGPQGNPGPQGDPGRTRVTLQSGDNLNSCLTKDYVYCTASTAVCESLVNTPYGFPAGELELEVVWLGSDNYLVQKLTCKNGATRKVYLRTYSAGTFGAWTEEGVPYGLCNTPGNTAAKVASISCYDRASSPYVAVKFAYANTAAAPTLNINNTGAAQIITNGSNAAYWEAGATVNLYWDGTYYQVASSPVYASEVTVGNPNGNNVHIGNSAAQIRYAGRTRAQVTGNGLEVLDADGNAKVASFGEDIQVGKSGPKYVDVEIVDNEGDGDNGIYLVHNGSQIGGIMAGQVPSANTDMTRMQMISGDTDGQGEVTTDNDEVSMVFRHFYGVGSYSGKIAVRAGSGNTDKGYTYIDTDNVSVGKDGVIKSPNNHQALTAQVYSYVSFSNTSYVKMKLEKSESIGDGFNMSDYGVKCKYAGTVLVSAQAQFSGVNDSNVCNVVLRNGLTDLAHSAARSSGNRAEIAVTPRLVQVNAGDVISMYVANSSTGAGQAGSTSSAVTAADKLKNYFTIQYV